MNNETNCSHCGKEFQKDKYDKWLVNDTLKYLCSICYNQKLCIILGSKKAAADYAASAIQ